MGTTTFKTNAYTGCLTYNECTTNIYTLSERTANARMITVQEAAYLGCTETEKTCPIWIYNHLYNSIDNGGTINDNHTENGASYNYGYWVMNSDYSYTDRAWHIGYLDTVGSRAEITGTNLGARAVVEINK